MKEPTMPWTLRALCFAVSATAICLGCRKASEEKAVEPGQSKPKLNAQADADLLKKADADRGKQQEEPTPSPVQYSERPWMVVDTTTVEHGSGVQRLAVSPDGTRMISAQRGLIRLWDVSGPEPRSLSSLRGLKDMDFAGVRSAVFLPDNKTVAMGVGGNTLRILDVSGKEMVEKFRFKDHVGNVQSLAVSPDGKTLASGSDDMTVLFYDITREKPMERFRIKLQEAGLGVKSIIYALNGRTLILGTGNGEVRLWDISGKGKEKAQAKVSTGTFLFHAALSPDGKTLAIANKKNKQLELWDVSQGKFATVHVWAGLHNREIGSIAWLPNRPIIAAADIDGKLVLYNAQTKEIVFEKQMTGHYENVKFIPTADKEIVRLAVANWKNPRGEITFMTFSPGN